MYQRLFSCQMIHDITWFIKHWFKYCSLAGERWLCCFFLWHSNKILKLIIMHIFFFLICNTSQTCNLMVATMGTFQQGHSFLSSNRHYFIWVRYGKYFYLKIYIYFNLFWILLAIYKFPSYINFHMTCPIVYIESTWASVCLVPCHIRRRRILS